MGLPGRESAGNTWEGRVLRDKYRIVRRVGAGGYSVVFEAEHLLLRRTVAIKILHEGIANDPRQVERFRREALAASRIGHPNIVEVLDLDRTDEGLDFIVLELLAGEDLAAYLKRVTRLDLHTALEYLVPVASALAAAHQAGIVHRDVKPDNVFLARRPDGSLRPKLVDFGIAKLDLQGGDMSQSITQAGTALGTPYYMSPEQIRGDKTIDFRTDLYSFGVMLYEVLAGSPPFEAPSLPSLVARVLFEEPTPISSVRKDLPLEVESLLRRLLQKEADARPADMDEVLEVLTGVQGRLLAPEDEPTVVSTTSSMDELVDDLDTLVMQSPLPSPGESAEVPLPASSGAFARQAPATVRVNEAALAHTEPQATPRPEARSPTPSTRARAHSPLERAVFAVAVAVAFGAIMVLTYWVVVSL